MIPQMLPRTMVRRLQGFVALALAVGLALDFVLVRLVFSSAEDPQHEIPETVPVQVFTPDGPFDADLSITKIDSPDPVRAGNELTYTITVTNWGPHADTGIVLVDTLPTGVLFVRASPGCGVTSPVTCNLGSLSKNASTVVTVVVIPLVEGMITNSASVRGNGYDPDMSNNMATQNTTVNPPPSVQFSAPSYGINENTGPAIVTATLSATSRLVITANYATSNGTAIAGLLGDYLTSTGTLTFTPGVNWQRFSIPIVDDMIFEGNETLTLTLSNPVNATLGGPNPAILTIMDNDVLPTAQFSAPRYSVEEDEDKVLIIATLNSASEMTATVSYTTTGGTATDGDYYPISGTLVFSPYATAEAFNVAIKDDSLDEADETILLALSNPNNAALGQPNPATLTIIDDDGTPSVRFGVREHWVNESMGQAVVTATLSNGSAFTSTAHVATVDGTATSEGDYRPLSSTLAFAPSETSITFTVFISDDTTSEDSETLTVTLSAPVSATLGAPDRTVLTIVDDDVPPGLIYLPVLLKNHCIFGGPDECEPNDTSSKANGPLVSGVDYHGRHNGSGEDRDYYSFYLPNSGAITIDLTDIIDDEFGNDVQLQLFYQSTAVRVGWDVTLPFRIVCPSPDCAGGLAGWYYILVYTPPGYNRNVPYSLRATFP